jgi:hypothetical protein
MDGTQLSRAQHRKVSTRRDTAWCLRVRGGPSNLRRSVGAYLVVRAESLAAHLRSCESMW